MLAAQQLNLPRDLQTCTPMYLEHLGSSSSDDSCNHVNCPLVFQLRRFRRPSIFESMSFPGPESIMLPRLITELDDCPLAGGPEGLPLGGGVRLSYPG